MQTVNGMVFRLLLHVLFILHVRLVKTELNFHEACSELSDAATGTGRYTDIVSRQNGLVCNKSSAGFLIWSRWISKRNAILRVVFRRCPRIERVWMMTEDDAHFVPTSSNLRITSCSNTNDTVIVPQDHHTKQKMDVHTLSEDGVKIVVLLEQRDGNSVYYTTHKYHLAPQSKHRHHRERRSADPAPQPETTDSGVTQFPLSQCAVNRTCIRFGSPNCHHMSCDYFLSYHVNNTESVDIELSGKTQGWVAVGFSSDNKMGGGDDIIACKRKDESTNEIQVMSLMNQVAHSSPKPKPSALTLTSWKFREGFIYCRVTRSLKVELSNNLDLSNDWFQLYARGPIGSSGVMLQHDDIPPTSKEKITMLINKHVYTSSASRRHLQSLGILCLVLSLLAIS